MTNFTCEECSRQFYDEELPHRGAICFGCHIKSVRLGFTYGKDNFHGDTIAEKQRQIMSDAAINGVQAEPVTNWM
jgi:hypothetical protein